MNKVFDIEVSSIVVSDTNVPTAYRITFTGPAEVPEVRIPYSDPLVLRATVTFDTMGDYVALAELLNQNDELLGSGASVSFSVSAPGETIEVSAVVGLNVSDA